MVKLNTSNWRKAWILPPLIIGIVFFMFMKSGKQPPQKIADHEKARAVRIVKATRVDLSPVTEGYGVVQPARVWTAVAQVNGRIIESHQRLRNGELIEKGEVLFKIDPVDYELNVATAKAQLAELEVQEKNAQASLAIEKRNQSIAERELVRLNRLADKGTASQSQRDEAERATLQSRAAVQNLENTLALIPTQRNVLQARLSQAERDLANTTVIAPFNLKIASLAMEKAQYVSKGQKLFEGDSIDQVEIITQVAISSLRNLFIGRENTPVSLDTVTHNIGELTGFKAAIELDMGSHLASWQARFVRFTDTVDPQTRTIGIVVAVDDPLKQVKPGFRPPLSKGMFVRVVLTGHTQPGRIIIPRHAVRGGKVYVINDQQRLQQRDVDILFNQQLVSVISSGISADDTIVVTDLIPAVDGMLLSASQDDQLQQYLHSQHAGRGNE
jgi:RND family efflux transporter MFP subunit